MHLTGNTILITGGTGETGSALAEVFHQRGNQVTVAGRHQARLDDITTAHPGMPRSAGVSRCTVVIPAWVAPRSIRCTVARASPARATT